MQVQAIQGYFDGGVFYQQGQRVSLPERKLVIVNVLDIPVGNIKTKEADVEFWKEFDKLAENSKDEQLMLIDFPRVNFNREFITFENEEQHV
jgi:hypothetical protein